MKSISVIGVGVWLALSTAAGYGYSVWAINNGRVIPVSGITLAISVIVVAVILISLAIPIWKYKRNLKKATAALEQNPTAKVSKPMPVDPFYAVRVLILARAGAVTASMLGGWHIGVLIKQYTSPVVVESSTGTNIAAGIASLVLLAVSFIVEWMCRLPNDPNHPGVKKDSAVPA
ncbi:MAG: DUF3180 domain-containing protein [Rhodoluna sp.]|nr:DUF3180 domain-containing protein [Rhodoluna sp.]